MCKLLWVCVKLGDWHEVNTEHGRQGWYTLLTLKNESLSSLMYGEITSSCSSFGLMISQITKNLVAQDHTDVLPWSSGELSCSLSVPGPKSRVQLGWPLLEAPVGTLLRFWGCLPACPFHTRFQLHVFMPTPPTVNSRHPFFLLKGRSWSQQAHLDNSGSSPHWKTANTEILMFAKSLPCKAPNPQALGSTTLSLGVVVHTTSVTSCISDKVLVAFILSRFSLTFLGQFKTFQVHYIYSLSLNGCKQFTKW